MVAPGNSPYIVARSQKPEVKMFEEYVPSEISADAKRQLNTTMDEIITEHVEFILLKLVKETNASLFAEDLPPCVHIDTPFLKEDGSGERWTFSFELKELVIQLIELRDSTDELITMAEAFEKHAKELREAAAFQESQKQH